MLSCSSFASSRLRTTAWCALIRNISRSRGSCATGSRWTAQDWMTLHFQMHRGRRSWKQMRYRVLPTLRDRPALRSTSFTLRPVKPLNLPSCNVRVVPKYFSRHARITRRTTFFGRAERKARSIRRCANAAIASSCGRGCRTERLIRSEQIMSTATSRPSQPTSRGPRTVAQVWIPCCRYR